MRRTPLVFAFVLLVAALAGSAAFAASPAQTTTHVQQVASGNLPTLPVELRVPGTQPVPTAAAKRPGKSAGNQLLGMGLQSTELACTWYTITCSNGTTDTCCGSESSCLSYCEEVCGGPCVYQN